MVELLGTRLKSLMGNVNFRSDYDQAVDSPERLLAVGEHNLREFEKIKAMGEKRQERIHHIISNILATVLQKEAIETYGDTDGSSIRQVLDDWHNQPENLAYWERLMKTAKQGLLGFNLTEDQCQTIMKYIFDRLPEVIIETMEELTSPLRFLPRAEAPSIASAIADIMKEANYAHG